MIINEVEITALRWVQQFVAGRKAALMRGKGNASGSLLRSFEVEATRMAQAEGIAIYLAFDDAGRFLDMPPKSFHHDVWGRNAHARLENWVKRKGVSRFLQGYMERRPNAGRGNNKRGAGLSLQTVISNIAWGISVKRTQGKFRRGKKLYNAPKTAAIPLLLNDIAAVIPDSVLQQTKKALLRQS